MRPPGGEGESDNVAEDGSVENELCYVLVLQVFYTFSFWLMFRQQMVERKEELLMKEESLDEVKVIACS